MLLMAVGMGFIGTFVGIVRLTGHTDKGCWRGITVASLAVVDDRGVVPAHGYAGSPLAVAVAVSAIAGSLVLPCPKPGEILEGVDVGHGIGDGGVAGNRVGMALYAAEVGTEHRGLVDML